jgi:hypothetical protein
MSAEQVLASTAPVMYGLLEMVQLLLVWREATFRLGKRLVGVVIFPVAFQASPSR